MEWGDGCACTNLEHGAAIVTDTSNLLDTICSITTDYSKRLSNQIDLSQQSSSQAQHQRGGGISCCNCNSSNSAIITTASNAIMMEHGTGDGAGGVVGSISTQTGALTAEVSTTTTPLHQDGTKCDSATTVVEAQICAAGAAAASSAAPDTYAATGNDNQSDVTRNNSTTTAAVSTDAATAAVAAAHYTLKSLSSTLYHDYEAHVLHQQPTPPVAPNYISGGCNTIQTLHQFRVPSLHHHQQQHHNTVQQNKALMPNGKVQTSILKKSTSAVNASLYPPSGNINHCISPTPYMTSSKSADSISNLTATLDRHSVGSCGSYGAARRASHLTASSALPSSFSNYSFNYNLVSNTLQHQPQPPFSSIASPFPAAAAAGSQTLNGSNFKRNSSSIIPLRNQPIGNQNLPDIFCHNHRPSAVMPSDSYYSFFTPSSNSVSTIPQAYEYYPLCSNPASPCEEKTHFNKMGSKETEVVGHTSTGGRPVSCRDLIVLTFIAAILMGMTLAFLVTLWFFLEQIECTSEGNCKNRHAPFT